MSECMEGTHQHVDVCNRVGRRLALAEVRVLIEEKRNEWANEYAESESDADYGRWDGWENALALVERAMTEEVRRG